MKAIYKKYLLVSISLFLLVSVWLGYSLFFKPLPEPSLQQLSLWQVSSLDWSDDMNYDGIETAVDRSISYYEQLPLDKDFYYGEYVYSPEEMIASMKLFLNIIQNHRDNDLSNELKKRFLFFESRNTEGNAFFTGYYEPVIKGSLWPDKDFTEPLYETPDDIVEVDLGQFSENWINEAIVGKLEGGRLVPYDNRDEIVYGLSLSGRARPIAYVSEIELFFLQIQGSGVIKLRDGSLKRVNYDQKNGHPYNSIGSILRDKILPEEISLQSIKSYLYSNPDEVRGILNYNQSYVFFSESENGPFGNIGVLLTPTRSIAMDKRIVPAGGLAFIETELPEFADGKVKDWKPVKRFALVQDTGGAIRDHGRVDIFFGQGKHAEMNAGYLKQNGRVFLLVARKEFLE